MKASSIAVVAILIAGQATAQPTGVLGFVSNMESESGETDIYTIRAGQTQATRLIASPLHAERNPAWSPDGTHLAAFYSTSTQRGVFIFTGDGRDPRFLVAGVQPSWRPDGTGILCAKVTEESQQPNWDIWAYDIGSGKGTRLTDDAALESYPDSSPDGSEVVFLRRLNGTQAAMAMSSDGSNLRRISAAGDDCGPPRWSPDGQWLALPIARAGEEQADLYLMRPDGTEVQPLTSTPTVSEMAPSWSRDGEFLAFPVRMTVDGSASMEIRWLDVASMDGDVLVTGPGGLPVPNLVNMDVQWLPEGAVSTGIASAAFGTVKSKHRRP